MRSFRSCIKNLWGSFDTWRHLERLMYAHKHIRLFAVDARRMINIQTIRKFHFGKYINYKFSNQPKKILHSLLFYGHVYETNRAIAVFSKQHKGRTYTQR